jgi:hypothetical protein
MKPDRKFIAESWHHHSRAVGVCRRPQPKLPGHEEHGQCQERHLRRAARERGQVGERGGRVRAGCAHRFAWGVFVCVCGWVVGLPRTCARAGAGRSSEGARQRRRHDVAATAPSATISRGTACAPGPSPVPPLPRLPPDRPPRPAGERDGVTRLGPPYHNEQT